jgi:hypothetical protein
VLGYIVTEKRDSFLFFAVFALLSLVLLASGKLNNQLLDAITVNNFHFGQTIICFTELALLCDVLRNYSKKRIILLYMIAFLTGFSDLVFLAQWIAPAVMALIFFGAFNILPKKKCISLAFGLLITGLLAFVLCHHFPFAKIDGITINSRIQHISQLPEVILYHKDVMLGLFYEMPLIACCYIGFLIGMLRIVLQTGIAVIFKKQTFLLHHPIPLFALILLFFSSVIGLAAIAQFDHPAAMRHYQFFILGSVFFGIPLLFVTYFPIQSSFSKPSSLFFCTWCFHCLSCLHQANDGLAQSYGVWPS